MVRVYFWLIAEKRTDMAYSLRVGVRQPCLEQPRVIRQGVGAVGSEPLDPHPDDVTRCDAVQIGDGDRGDHDALTGRPEMGVGDVLRRGEDFRGDRKSTRLNSSHMSISYAVFC